MAVAEKANKTTKLILTAIIAVVLVAVVVLLVVVLTLQNGFVVDTIEKDDGTSETVVYYYVNGEKQVGWQVIGDDKYYFNEDGTMYTGWLDFGGDQYYFRKGDPGNTANKPASEYDRGGELVIDREVSIADDNGVRYWYIFDAYGKVAKKTLVK